MTNSTCTADGCERKIYFRGKCHGHYVRVGRPKPRPCKMDGCEKRARCQDLCDMHYTRLRRHNDPAAIMNADRTLGIADRLERVGWVITESGCWEYAGATRNGYGQISIPGNHAEVASRAAYKAWIGEIGDGLYVCHRCDNPPCINPEHLFLGTHQENVRDCVSKMRHQYGERQWEAKLSDASAREIRELYATGAYTQKGLGKLYGVSQTAIGLVVRGETWRHLS